MRQYKLPKIVFKPSPTSNFQITRVRNKWKFHLKDGIMNLKGKDYLFQKATGEGEW